MSYAEIPWTAEIAAAVETGWDLPLGPAERLTGGEESAAYRVGGVVVRIGAVGRRNVVMEWCHQVARRTAEAGVCEVVVPLVTAAGASVVQVDGRPVSVWPVVAGRWLDSGDVAEVEQAARLLARVHRALDGVAMPERPEVSYLEPNGRPVRDVLRDAALDRWLKEFTARAGRQPLHGDYYRGNLLVSDGRISGLIDWDEAWVGVPEMELAGAAREFGDEWSGDLTRAREFVAWYHDEGGTAGPMDDETLVQLIRHRLRSEVVAFAEDDDHDEYHTRQVDLFTELCP